MKWRLCLLILVLLGSRVSAQVVSPVLMDTAPPSSGPGTPADSTSPNWFAEGQPAGSGSTSEGGPKFSNFIGFLSNPLQNIDPRSLTQIVPIFGSTWASTIPALPNLDGQIYGPAISVAVTDRLCIGLNQGGYAVIHINRNDPRGPLLNLLRQRRGDEFGGTRDGFLNLGGFAQYTVIEDVENQFLATVGMRLVVPSGSYEVFQGKGPALLSPYATIGKEFGNFHLLATGGYQFPARSGDSGTDLFYLNAHLDRQCFGWIYPLVEANWSYHSTSVDVALPTRQGIINFGNYESTGNVLTIAAGVNLVLVRDKLEFGAVYARPVSTQKNVDINTLLVKMVIRF